MNKGVIRALVWLAAVLALWGSIVVDEMKETRK